MFNIPSTRLTVPRAAAGEIVRKNLIDTVLNSPAKLVYIHAGAGHGKTTLLSQVAYSAENAVWLSLDGESDIIELTQKDLAFTREKPPISWVLTILTFTVPRRGGPWPSVPSRYCWRTAYQLATLLPTAGKIYMPIFSMNA